MAPQQRERPDRDDRDRTDNERIFDERLTFVGGLVEPVVEFFDQGKFVTLPFAAPPPGRSRGTPTRRRSRGSAIPRYGMAVPTFEAM